MNDLELQLGLAKLLPEKVRKAALDCFQLKHPNGAWLDLHDTEWLHICHAIEQNLTNQQHKRFCKELRLGFPEKLISEEWISASWQQRATALLKIIPVEAKSNTK